MPIDGWSVVASFGDQISAQALLGLLTSESMPSMVISNAAVPGLGTEFSVLVPTPQLRKAQLIREQNRVSDEELTYLATGELPGGPKHDP
jgi:hypothetical protein